MSFSMLNFSSAADAMSTLSCCISSLMSTFLIMAFGTVELFSFGPKPASAEDMGASSFSDMKVGGGDKWMRNESKREGYKTGALW